MECAVCKAGVDDFHLESSSENTSSHAAPQAKWSAPESSNVLLPSAFDNNPFVVHSPPMFERVQMTSTPVMDDSLVPKSKEPLVLRIDNVPWVGLSHTFLIEG